MDGLIIAIAGGTAGVFLTLMAGVPRAVRDHDRLVAQTDEDLAQWVSDECVRLERALSGHLNSAGKQLYSGAYLRGIAHLKEEALHLYRDQERQARARLGEWSGAEGTVHWLWRKAQRRPFPTLMTPGQAKPILDGWRADVSSGGHSAPVSDPTKLPLSWATGKYGDEARPWDRFLPEVPGE